MGTQNGFTQVSRIYVHSNVQNAQKLLILKSLLCSEG